MSKVVAGGIVSSALFFCCSLAEQFLPHETAKFVINSGNDRVPKTAIITNGSQYKQPFKPCNYTLYINRKHVHTLDIEKQALGAIITVETENRSSTPVMVIYPYDVKDGETPKCVKSDIASSLVDVDLGPGNYQIWIGNTTIPKNEYDVKVEGY